MITISTKLSFIRYRQIGIVPQEPLLFGSVSDNIALTDPNASSEVQKLQALLVHTSSLWDCLWIQY